LKNIKYINVDVKTVYASLKELNVELFINGLGRPRQMGGRPLT
jgi:hypothetical protein